MTVITDDKLTTDAFGYPQFVVRMDPGSTWQALNALLRQEATATGLHLKKTRDAIKAIREATGWLEEAEARAMAGDR